MTLNNQVRRLQNVVVFAIYDRIGRLLLVQRSYSRTFNPGSICPPTLYSPGTPILLATDAIGVATNLIHDRTDDTIFMIPGSPVFELSEHHLVSIAVMHQVGQKIAAFQSIQKNRIQGTCAVRLGTIRDGVCTLTVVVRIREGANLLLNLKKRFHERMAWVDAAKLAESLRLHDPMRIFPSANAGTSFLYDCLEPVRFLAAHPELVQLPLTVNQDCQ